MSMLTHTTRALRAEAVRLRRLWLLPALSLALAIAATVLAFSGSGGAGRSGGGSSSSGTESALGLAEPDGIVAGLDTGATLVGLLTLVLWALSVARDHQTGVIRVLLVTQSRRGVLLAGKLAALGLATALTSCLAVGASTATAYGAAAANGVSTSAWDASLAVQAVLDVSLASLTWGTIGAALATATRSAAAAIAGGIGYLLLGENLIGSVSTSAERWLPGASLDNLLTGGSDAVSYAQSASVVAVTLLIGLAVCTAVTLRRNVTE